MVKVREYIKETILLRWLLQLMILTVTCVIFGSILLTLALGGYTTEGLKGYFLEPIIIVLNVLPILFIASLVYIFVKKISLSFFIGGGIALALSLGNYYKITFRDDPLIFEDLLIVKEAAAMTITQSYSLFIDQWVILTLLSFLLLVICLIFIEKHLPKINHQRLYSFILAILIISISPMMFSKGVYESIENYNYLNRWSTTQNYISRGFLYPFIHSIRDSIRIPPTGYDDKSTQNLLTQYVDIDIPQNKRVNIISIMREAYIDFSQYNILGLDCSGYDQYNQLELVSYTGNLLTNAFGGGTIDTERCFLTGDYKLYNFRNNVNSYLWYLRQQGYTVEGIHPFYKWFYNRQNVNKYLGFENYRYLENDFEYLTDAYMPEDSIFYEEIYNDFKNRDIEKPYFSFSLNIQSHGPYPTEYYTGEKEYLTGNYTEECRNAMNNYMDIIMDSDVQLMKFVDALRQESEPVVLILFSDHMPWMGDGNRYYDEMQINLDMETEEGFRTYYSTRYLIWANPTAKRILENDFNGKGPTISPCYLMNLAFEQFGWEGPAFMQMMNKFLEHLQAITSNGRFIIDNKFTDYVPEKYSDLYKEFLYCQYYWSSGWQYKNNIEIFNNG